MGFRRFSGPLLLTLGLLVACAPADSGRDLVAPVEQSEPTRSINEITHALAVSLAEPQSRRALIAVMRKSPFTRHRVDLQTLFDAPEAVQLANRVANVLGLERSELNSFVIGDGEFDVVVPDRNQREQWKGSGSIAVAGYDATTTDPQLAAFRDDGNRFALEYGKIIPGVTQILVEPSQPKHIRVGIKNRLGDVIQDPDDGGMGGIMSLTLPNGEVVRMQIAEWRGRRAGGVDQQMTNLLQECNPDTTDCPGGSGGGTTPVSADTTLLVSIVPIGEPDCWGWSDPTIKAWFYVNGVAVDFNYLEYSDHDSNANLNDPLLFRRIHTNADEKIYVRVIERDGLACGGDDDWGARWWYYFDNNVTRTLYDDDQVARVNVRLRWTPIAAGGS